MSQTIIKDVKEGNMALTILGLSQISDTITIEEVQSQLKKDFPAFSWTKKEVGSYMVGKHLDGSFTFEDNGTYRVYVGETSKKSSSKKGLDGKRLPKVKTVKIGMKAAWDLMLGSKGSFFTAEFIKKDKEARVMNCQVLKDQDPSLGYIKVKEVALMRAKAKNAIKQINIQTLTALKIGGVAYTITKSK